MATSTTYECTLSEEVLKKAVEELNENPETRTKDVQILREKVLSNQGLTCQVDDGFLLRFLRARKFDQDRAYNLLVSYYTMRAQNANQFRNLTPSALTAVLDSHIVVVLPKTKPTQPRIVYFRPGFWDPEKFNIWEVFRGNMLAMENVIMDEDTQVNGIHLIGDFVNIGWNQAKNVDRAYAGLTTKVLQCGDRLYMSESDVYRRQILTLKGLKDGFPLRLKGIHIVNEPGFFSIVFAIVKPFMKSKMASRMFLHGSSYEAIQELVGVESLPEELGGTLGPAEQLYKSWNKDILTLEDTYTKMLDYKIEFHEDVSVGQKEDSNVITGVTGTFKKLNVD